jgi:pyridoxine/pyridoxamine 5'-phosphate oxidase
MSDALASEVPEPGTEDDPFAVFASWFADAQKSEPEDPNAMAIATVDASGLQTSGWSC